ncbi:MAG: ribbon-helix-helix domain-containing protein [Alphaproteobacteria bacterium]|nr:ribbon-helix-helix domain-containing protein [Alphaproteobacteria bacterium]MCB9931103.1 ribbon-helix-helix domain-containing protein [Alphaproteobacteria bacterium]
MGRIPQLDDHMDIANRLAMRSVTINGRRTTMRLEPSMWNALRRIAEEHRLTVNQLCSKIDNSRGEMSMTAAVRSYIVSYLQQMPTTGGPSGEAQSIDSILEQLGPAYAKGELLRVRIERGDDVMVKVAFHTAVLERGEIGPLAELYREWARRRDQLQYLPRITELSARLLRRAAQETMLSVVDLAAGGTIAQPHQDPVMAWNTGGTGHRPHPLLRAAFQQDMLAVEQQGEAMYQINQISLGGTEQVYKRLLLPLSDDGSDVTRVLVAAMPLDEEVEPAAAG